MSGASVGCGARVSGRSSENGGRAGTRTGDGLGAAGVGDADELVEEGGVLVVVPVAEDDGVLRVVRVGFFFGVDDERCAQTVDVLALRSCEWT